jgi:hypothetical protein
MHLKTESDYDSKSVCTYGSNYNSNTTSSVDRGNYNDEEESGTSWQMVLKAWRILQPHAAQLFILMNAIPGYIRKFLRIVMSIHDCWDIIRHNELHPEHWSYCMLHNNNKQLIILTAPGHHCLRQWGGHSTPSLGIGIWITNNPISWHCQTIGRLTLKG